MVTHHGFTKKKSLAWDDEVSQSEWEEICIQAKKTTNIRKVINKIKSQRYIKYKRGDIFR
jgi:hypothetical protein